MIDLVAMDDVSKLINYAHSDWLRGEGRGLCRRLIPRNTVECIIILPNSNKALLYILKVFCRHCMHQWWPPLASPLIRDLSTTLVARMIITLSNNRGVCNLKQRCTDRSVYDIKV